jgi:hypothetical protein
MLAKQVKLLYIFFDYKKHEIKEFLRLILHLYIRDGNNGTILSTI